MNNDCPNSADGRHKYYLFKTFMEYEPSNEELWKTVRGDEMAPETTSLYQKIEYALSGCNCGAAIKQRITDGGVL